MSLADARGKLPMDKLLEMKLDGVAFDHLASVYEDYTGKIAVENLRPSWLIFSAGFRKSRVLSAAKRLMDVGVVAIGLVARAARDGDSWPLAIKLTSAGSSALPPEPRRPAWPHLHGAQVPVDAARCRKGDRAGLGCEGGRSPRHADRPCSTPQPARRVAATVERADRAT